MRTCPDCQTSYDDEVLHCPEDGHNLSGVEPVDELIGRSIGSYKILKPLGKGGMGAVYLAQHPVIGSKVAIKFLHPQYANDAKIVDRFFNEARAVNLIGHDNVLKISDLNITEDNRHYFIMEFLQGRALQNIVRPNEPLGLDITGPMLLQTCNALQAAHNKGIFHRDLKPDNIYLITLNGRKNFVKVVDFGIAKVTEGGVATGKTQTGMVMGTPAYMSPEQGSGQTNKIDGRSDIYSLGVMMFQMATGRLPFPGSNFGEVLMGHLQKQPPAPRSLVPSIPEAYEAIILKCLEKSQDDRFQSMADLHDAIFDLMQELGISADLPLADATEELPAVAEGGTPSNPNSRTPSRPGRTNPPRPPGVRNTVPRRNSKPNLEQGATEVDNQKVPSSPGRSLPGRSLPGRSMPGRRSPSQAPTEATRSKLPLFLGLGAAVVLLGGGGAFLAVRSANQAEQARLVAEKDKREAIKAKERAAEAAAEVLLSVITEPPGASVEATWKDGSRTESTPFSLAVLKNSKVRFEFKKSGYLSQVTEAVADSAQTVSVHLVAQPKPPPPADSAQASATPPAKPKPARKPDKSAPRQPTTDGLINPFDN